MMQAGFEVVGVDKDPHPNYPGEFIQGDVFEDAPDVMGFNFVWASPPCQRFSDATNGYDKSQYPDFVADTRELINVHPFTCIENVPRAPIRPDYVLTGPMFGLDKILRKRRFEVSWGVVLAPTPTLKKTTSYANGFLVIVGHCTMRRLREGRRKAGLPAYVHIDEAKEAMGVEIEMTWSELSEAIPPAYSKFIATQAKDRILRNGR